MLQLLWGGDVHVRDDDIVHLDGHVFDVGVVVLGGQHLEGNRLMNEEGQSAACVSPSVFPF